MMQGKEKMMHSWCKTHAVCVLYNNSKNPSSFPSVSQSEHGLMPWYIIKGNGFCRHKNPVINHAFCKTTHWE